MTDRRTFLKASGLLAGAAILAGRSALAAGTAPGEDVGNDPSYLPASDLLARFRDGSLSPPDVLEAQIKRIEALNGDINCITYRHYDEARAAAAESAKRYRNGNPRALEGLTVAVKDEYEVKGWITTMGSRTLANASPSTIDNAVIDKLRKAGAVMHIQTTVPEFYVWTTTATDLWGVTRNPWNPAFTPGGSSGGSGSALAAGFTTLALGSDMGGSIRIPASQCGLYGFKPPFGRVPTSEIPYETQGPLARSFEDLNLLIQAIDGPHPLVHSSLRPKLDFPADYPPISGLRIAYDPMPGISELDSTVAAAIGKAIAVLEGLGATVETVDLGFQSSDADTYYLGLFSTSMGSMLTQVADRRGELMPYTLAMIDRMMGKAGPDAATACEMLLVDYHNRTQQRVFEAGYQALLAPTLATPLIPAEHGLKPGTDTVEINGRPVTGLGFSFTWPWNLLGRYPVVTAPVGLGAHGMPIGMQIIANTFDDLTAFRVASAYSTAARPFFAGDLFPNLQPLAA